YGSGTIREQFSVDRKIPGYLGMRRGGLKPATLGAVRGEARLTGGQSDATPSFLRFAVFYGTMETYGELRTLIRALQARDVLSADDNDLLPSAFPLEDKDNLCVL